MQRATDDEPRASWDSDHAVQAYVDLYWIPLGAGGWFVRRNGRLYERLVAVRDGRRPLDLYHSALVVGGRDSRFVIEQAPVPDPHGSARGAVAEGAVGSRAAGRLRLFRYEVRRWRDGVIPDVDEAVESPRRLTTDAATAGRLLDLVPEVPTPVWGRDELKTGEMWNSNAIISWLLACSGLEVERIRLPSGGRAPGWHAGIVVARRATAAPPSRLGAGDTLPRPETSALGRCVGVNGPRQES